MKKLTLAALAIALVPTACQSPLRSAQAQEYAPSLPPPGCRPATAYRPGWCKLPGTSVYRSPVYAPPPVAAPPVDFSAPPVPELPPGPPASLPPLGWVFGPYTSCADPPRCAVGMVTVAADGLNVRAAPNGPAVMALTNGTPLVPLGREGPWLLVAAGCDLTPTFAWSWTAGVPLNRCWIY